MKKAEGRPETVEAAIRELKMSHIHFLDGGSRRTFLGESYKAVRQINGADFVAHPGESLRIHSRSATAIENLRSCGQSLDKFLALGLDELVGLLEMPTVVVRTFVIGLFNMRIISVFSFHVVIVARHGRAMEGISCE